MFIKSLRRLRLPNTWSDTQADLNYTSIPKKVKKDFSSEDRSS